MSRADQYRKRFVDIRVKPPREGADGLGQDDDLKPGQIRCEMPQCREVADCKALKHAQGPREFYHFCKQHAAEYNKDWNYFEGLNEGQAQAARDAALYGERPTWAWKAVHHQGISGAARAQARGAKGYKDVHGVLGERAKRAAEPAPRLTRLQLRALADLSLELGAGPEDIKRRYSALVKRLHPDSNGGDHSAKTDLARVIKAFKVLKTTGLV